MVGYGCARLTVSDVTTEEFNKYVELVASMSIDYMVKGKLTKETYVANLAMIAKIMDEKLMCEVDCK